MTTRPCQPSAFVRSAMSSTEEAPRSPGSCRWISTSTSKRSARPNTTSRRRTGSRSIVAGSSPPTTSAPLRSASSINSTVPGRTSIPLCGKATIWVSRASRKSSRVRITPSKPASPQLVSMSTNVRMCVVPAATARRACLLDCACASIPRARRSSRSLSIMARRCCGTSLWYQPRPSSVLSMWAWTSTKPGKTSRPPPSITSTPSAASPGPAATMRPSRISTSMASACNGRTLRISRSLAMR